MLAAQLNELGISHTQPAAAQPEAPHRNNRQNSSSANAGGGGGGGGVSSGKLSNSSGPPNNHQPPNPLDPIDISDTDSEPEETNERGRNDGTLLASDPPKPL